MHPLLNIAITAARQAGDIILRHADELHRIKVLEKKPNDFYSEVDIKAEQTIIHTIHKAYPQHGIIAEESGVYNPEAEYVWIIDPLDGTRNYLHGFPFYAVSIAVRVKQRIEHGVVYDPLRHECFAATRGAGARLNDHRLRVTQQAKLSAAMIGTSFPSREETLTAHHLGAFQTLFGACAGLRRIGCAALDLAYVAAGRLDGCWALGLSPWDMAAGALLIQEAGGLVGDLQGGEAYLKQGNIVGGTPKLFKTLLQTINSA